MTAPDFVRETFQGPRVDHSTRSDERTELTYVEYSHDPDPDDTTMETVVFYLIREEGKLRIEQDLHILGLFPKASWLNLMEETGFRVLENMCFFGDEPGQGCLLLGILKERE